MSLLNRSNQRNFTLNDTTYLHLHICRLFLHFIFLKYKLPVFTSKLSPYIFYCRSAVKSCPTLWLHELLLTMLLCPSLSSRVCSDSCPLSWWYYLTISSSATSFSLCLQTSPASESFPMSWPFKSGGQSITTSASASVLPKNIQSWFPLGLTGLISWQSKGLSNVFSSTTAQRHQFFGIQPSLWSNSHMHMWLLEKP